MLFHAVIVIIIIIIIINDNNNSAVVVIIIIIMADSPPQHIVQLLNELYSLTVFNNFHLIYIDYIISLIISTIGLSTLRQLK